jgi:hypothetical protein
MGGVGLQEHSRIREISSMKWNTPDWLLGLPCGTLFGLYVAMSLVRIIEPSSDA